MLPIFAHYLGSEGYGIFGMLEVISGIMTVIVGYGLLGGMQRFYFEKETETERKTVISTAIIVTVLIVLIVCFPVFLLKKQISHLAFGDPVFANYVAISVVAFFFDMTAQSAGGYLLIKQNSLLFTLFSIQRFILSVVLNIYFLIYLEMGVLGLLYSSLISVIIYSASLHIHALWHVGLSFSRDDAQKIIRFNLPLIPGYIAGLVRNDADKVILRSFLGLAELGSYNMLLKFSSLIVLFVVQPFLRIWTVKRLEACETSDGPDFMAKMFTIQLALMLFVGLILALEVPLVLRIMTPQEFWMPGFFVLLAVFAKILFGAYYHFNFGLIYEKITYKISVIQTVTALFGLAMSFVFIKYFEILGALIASNLMFFFQCILAHVISNKYYRIPFEWTKISGLIFTTSILFFMIDGLDISTHLSSGYFIDVLSSLAVKAMNFLSLNNFRGGVLMTSVIGYMPLLVEGLVKLVLSFSYIGVLVVCGLVTYKQLINFMKLSVGKLKFATR